MNLSVDRYTGEVARALHEAGIRMLLLKGPSFVRWLYADSGDRAYGDCDLLVAPSQYPHAERVLAQRGFSRRFHDRDLRDWQLDLAGMEWRRGSDGASVDLHQTLYGIGIEDQDLWQVLTEATEVMEVGGVPVEVLSVPARALHVGLHLAAHGVRDRKATSDLARALEVVDLSTWQRAAELAERLGALPAFAAALRTQSPGVALADSLRLSEPVPRRVAVFLTTPEPGVVKWELLLGDGAKSGRRRLILRTLLPRARVMRQKSELARRHRGGLALAYLLRFGRLIRRTPASFVQWWRLRKAATGTTRVAAAPASGEICRR